MDHEAELERLRAKGWTEARVSRWLAEKTQAEEREARAREAEPTPGTNGWLTLIGDVLRSGLTLYLGILLHWYSGPLSRRMQLRGRETIPMSQVTIDTLANLKEDVIHVFLADAPARILGSSAE